MNTKISEAAVEAARDAYTEADTRGVARTGPMRVALEAALPHLQGEAVPVAWIHEDDEDRVISATQKATAIRDGGACASSVKPYTVAAYLHPQPAEQSEVPGDSGELPPLPQKVVVDRHLPTGVSIYGYSAEQMQEYARGALAATGKQQVGEVQGSREQFEAWASSIGAPVEADQHGNYIHGPLNFAKLGWDAALASRQPVERIRCDMVDGELTVASAIEQVVELFPSADRAALRTLAACFTHQSIYRYAAPPAHAVDLDAVADALRELLAERQHRTDGDLLTLADRCRHLSRGDRDCIAMRGTIVEKLEADQGTDLGQLSRLSDAWLATQQDRATDPIYGRALWACAKELRDALALIDGRDARARVDHSEPSAPSTTLYVDLDGVMADFDGAFPSIFGLDHRSLADDEMWGHINSHASFFRDLRPMAGAIEFFRSVEHLNPVILTACPKSNYAHVAAQKRAWVRAHLSQTCLVLPVMGGRNKPLFMHQAGDVLIDDFGKNCLAWTEAGGVAIKHEGDWLATAAALADAMSRSATLSTVQPPRDLRTNLGEVQ